MALSKIERRQRIKFRIKKIVSGTAQKPRLVVFRSNSEIYAQIIDDTKGVTKKALAAGIESISFDRGGYLYHGRVKSLAEGAREGGLKF